MKQSGSKAFLNEDFLLENHTARVLYHDYARDLPIIDYHNHLPPTEIAADKRFDNITAIWLDGDHYKWRAMRTLGIDERYITGDASDREKFAKWAETVPYTVRNPLYHWSHLELQRYFDIADLLGPDTAEEIYERSSELLGTKGYSTRSLLEKMNVEVVCTTDDPADDLAHHSSFTKDTSRFRMLPAFRPDKAILIGNDGFVEYIGKLGRACGREIASWSMLLQALHDRMDYFHARGCRLADHGLEALYAEDYTAAGIEKIFKKRMEGGEVGPLEKRKFISATLHFLCKSYSEKGWVQQFHLGALRNNNSRMSAESGPDTGWDSIGDFSQAASLSAFMDRLEKENKLAKTILYNLNPGDNEVFATMAGNFNTGDVRGKIQFGSAWWFLDQKDGIEKQLNALSNMGMISCFIGMLTDSRSFLSFPRHEYFRRVLCNLFGRDVHNGELPNDIPWLGKIISDICYHNARAYFEFHKVKV